MPKTRNSCSSESTSKVKAKKVTSSNNLNMTNTNTNTNTNAVTNNNNDIQGIDTQILFKQVLNMINQNNNNNNNNNKKTKCEKCQDSVVCEVKKQKNAHKYRVYIAGSLFNTFDRIGQCIIANLLERAGYQTFLPQRDGLELDNIVQIFITLGYTEAQADELASKLIFEFDRAQLKKSDAIVTNANGTEPDSGTVAETAFAYEWGKAVVIYTDDIRVFSEDALLNPLFVQTQTVPVVSDVCNIPLAVEAALIIKQNERENKNKDNKKETRQGEDRIKNNNKKNRNCKNNDSIIKDIHGNKTMSNIQICTVVTSPQKIKSKSKSKSK